MPMYQGEIRFNSRMKGARQVHAGKVECENPHEALDLLIGQAVRLPGHGAAIFVTGFTIDEQREPHP